MARPNPGGPLSVENHGPGADREHHAWPPEHKQRLMALTDERVAAARAGQLSYRERFGCTGDPNGHGTAPAAPSH